MSTHTPPIPAAARLPLEGVTVLEVGSRIAAVFSASILAEQGARVIKIEDPNGGDVMRTINPFLGEQSLFFSVEDRNRAGATLNLRHPEGQQLFRELAERADVLCENFRPGTMENWHLGPKDLNPNLIYARVSVFGQDGPYSQRPGLDLTGIAYGGLLHLTGPSDLPPVKSSVTVSDHLTAVFVAQAISAALYRRRVDGDGRGAVIDATLYGSILRTTEATVAEFVALGASPERGRPRPVDGAPAGVFRTSDEYWVAVSAGSNAAFGACARLLERDEWLSSGNYASVQARYKHALTLNEELRSWVARHPIDVVVSMCRDAHIPVSPVNSSTDLLNDPHIAARKDLPQVNDHVVGHVRQPAAFPRFEGLAAPLEGAPTLGEHNRDVWCDLVGLSQARLESLIATGVI